MLAELSIIPLGNSAHLSGELAKVLKLVDESGLPYPAIPGRVGTDGRTTEKKGEDRLRVGAQMSCRG